jgi:iron complex outermembrane receptor protein
MCHTVTLAQQGQAVIAAANGASNTPDAAAAPKPVRLAQAASPAPATAPALQLQQVVVTGSLIAGTPAIGAPLQTLTTQDFLNAGALNISEAMKNIPSVETFSSLDAEGLHNDLSGVSPINIHGLGSLETLLLVDGMRTPLQAKNRFVSPDFINAIALEGVDVLADGASATYGADAVAGVVNLRLAQNYDGAKTQASYVDGKGFSQEQIGQLFGRQWNGGGFVVSYEFERDTPLLNAARPSLFTDNYSGYGGLNETLVGSSIPATLTTGKVSYANGLGGPCSNCYAVPAGIGPTGVVDFSSLTRGTNNEVNPFDYGDVTPAETVNGVTLAFHQDITQSIQFFSENWFSDREISENYFAGGANGRSNAITVALPATGYPYLAPGYPTNLQANLNTDNFLQGDVTGGETNYHFGGGLRFVLGYGWHGTAQIAQTQDTNVVDEGGLINTDNLEALLGETVTAAQPGATGQTVTVTPPSGLGTFNIFCDAAKYSCLSPAQLAYMEAYSDETTISQLREMNTTFNGPLFPLPGGEVRMAVGADTQIQDYTDTNPSTLATASAQLPAQPSVSGGNYAYEHRSVWSFFGQLNVPVVGQNNAVPLVKALNVQASGRFDHYSDFGSTTNPKIALDWVPVDGLKLSASYGTSFHAPPLVDESEVGAQISGINGIGKTTINTVPNCPAGATSPAAGSAGAAILAATGGTCATEPYSQGLLLKQITSPGVTLGPETSRNWNIGAEFSPPQIPGLDIDLSYYNVKIRDVIGAVNDSNQLYNPNLSFLVATVGQPGFASEVAKYLGLASSQIPYSAANASEVQFMEYFGDQNLGILEQEGVDFDASYTLPENLTGTWKVGVTGSYTFHQYYSAAPGLPLTDIAGTNTPGPEGESPLNVYMRDYISWTRKGLNVTAFANYQSGYTNTIANSYPAKEPSFTTVDLSVGYDFGDQFTSRLLSGLSLHLEATNLFNRYPPLGVGFGDGATFDEYYFSPLLRTINLTVTENW